MQEVSAITPVSDSTTNAVLSKHSTPQCPLSGGHSPRSPSSSTLELKGQQEKGSMGYNPDSVSRGNDGGDDDRDTNNKDGSSGRKELREGATDETEWLEGMKLTIVIAGVTLVAFLMFLDMSIIATAIPKITNQFHSLDDVAWYGSAYQLANASLQPLTGKFYTYFSSKWMLLGFFGIFELGSLICGVATSSMMLIIGRAVAGIGCSGMMNGGLTIIAGAAPMHKRPGLIGVVMGIAQLGVVLGPLIGGAFTTYSTWRWCFFINLPLGALVAVLLAFIKIPDQTPKEKASKVLKTFFKKLDILGFVLFAPASIMLLLALQYGSGQYAWNSSTVIGLFCGAGATFVVFFAWEYHVGMEAMIPLQVISNRIIWCSCLTGMTLMGATINFSYWMPMYFQSVRGKSAVVSGVNLLPVILCQLVMAVVSGILTGRTGYYLPWAVFGGALNSVATGLLTTLNPTTPTRDWAGYQALSGFGRGASMQPAMIAVQNAVPPATVSTALAILTFSQTYGGAIFLTVAQVIFEASLRTAVPHYAPTVDPQTVISAGATGFRDVIGTSNPAALKGVIKAYSVSIDRTFWLGLGLAIVSFGSSWGLGWRDVRKKEEEEEEKVGGSSGGGGGEGDHV